MASPPRGHAGHTPPPPTQGTPPTQGAPPRRGRHGCGTPRWPMTWNTPQGLGIPRNFPHFLHARTRPPPRMGGCSTMWTSVHNMNRIFFFWHGICTARSVHIVDVCPHCGFLNCPHSGNFVMPVFCASRFLSPLYILLSA